MAQSLNDTTRFTFLDVLNRECHGDALLLGNALAQTNEILEDLLLIKGNEKKGNRVTKYSSLGNATRRRANQGINPSKSGTIQQYDACSIWADRLAIDELVAEEAADKALMIMQEIEAKRENLNIQMAYDLFYGNPTSVVDSMLGIQPRLNTSTIPTVILGGGSSALTSAYLITHELNTFVAFYPESHPAGIKYVNRGPNQPITDSSGKVFYGEVHDLEWALGVSLKNERRCARVANIASGSLSAYGSLVSTAAGAASTANGPDLLDLLLRGQNSVQNIKDAGKCWYGNRTLMSYVSRQWLAKPNHLIQRQEFEDMENPIWRINGIRFRLVEQITNSETAVV